MKAIVGVAVLLVLAMVGLGGSALAGPAASPLHLSPAAGLVVPVLQQQGGCPPGSVPVNGSCKPITCGPGYVREGSLCVCPPPNVPQVGVCKPCPAGLHGVNGSCEPPPPIICLPGQVRVNGRCTCPPGKVAQGLQCVTPPPKPQPEGILLKSH